MDVTAIVGDLWSGLLVEQKEKLNNLLSIYAKQNLSLQLDIQSLYTYLYVCYFNKYILYIYLQSLFLNVTQLFKPERLFYTKWNFRIF